MDNIIFNNINNYNHSNSCSSKKNSSKDNTTKENKEYIPYMCLDSNNKPSKNCLGGWFYHLSDILLYYIIQSH